MTILGWLDRSQRRRSFVVQSFLKDLPFPIFVKTEDVKKRDCGLHTIVRVAVHSTRKGLEGKIVEVFPSIDDPELEIAIVQQNHGFPIPFSAEALEVSTAAHRKPEGQRTDLTHAVTVTIDGETAKDFDDAISVQILKNGHYNLKVSIADVSHFVDENSALDRDAYERGTSIYFPGTCIPMLPENISNDLCSLVPEQNRQTLTCEMEINPSGEILRSRIYPSTIRSAARLTYTAVAKVLEGQQGVVAPKIERMLKEAFELSQIVRDNRFSRGALDLDLPETEFVVTPSGDVARIARAERNEAHKLIEDFMILANEVVSSQIEAKGYPSIFRVHEVPDPLKIERLQKVIRHWGFNISTKRDLVDSLQRYLDTVRGHPHEKILVVSLLRSLKQAQYSAMNVGHFGLGSESYCHFTSPIRRYPDLMIHRILRKSNFLKASKPPYSTDRLHIVSKQCSELERRAFLAERDMEDIKKCRFLESKVGKSFEGVITSVKSFGLFVEILPFFVEGLIPTRTLGYDAWKLDELETSIKGLRSRREFWLGDRVKVKLVEVDRLQRQVTFKLETVLRAKKGS